MSGIDALLESSNLRRDPIVPTVAGEKAVYLHAGQLHATAEPTEITTVLGSCVAVCLWDAVAKVGGMCHYMLPHEVGGKSESPRYASFAIRELIDRIIALGGHRHRLQARIFGGGSMLHMKSTTNDLGGKNAAVALDAMEREQIPVLQLEVRGNHGRRVVFRTNDGSVVVRRVG